MLEKISLIAHSALRIETEEGKIIYFDPFKLDNTTSNDADYIFITHPHYDHFSPQDILKIKKDNTKIVAPTGFEEEIKKLNFHNENILLVTPNQEYSIDKFNFSTIPAYNISKDYHKKEYNWIGYVVNIDNTKIYVAGDTDNTIEAKNVKCDIACIPIGGIYTMNWEEAVNLIKEIKPNTAIPTHYKTIVGTQEDAYKFEKALKNVTEVKILMD